MTAILLVDDDGPFRRTLAEQLRDEQGFETQEAENAAAAGLGGASGAMKCSLCLPSETTSR